MCGHGKTPALSGSMVRQSSKRGIRGFIIRCERSGRKVVLLTGGYNPVLTRYMDPALRPDMVLFLEGITTRHTNVVLAPESALPVQTPADYIDLNHVTELMRQRFTERLADMMKDWLTRTK
jgi:hypothetical protein